MPSPPIPDADATQPLRSGREHRTEARIELDVDGPKLRQPGGRLTAIKLHDLSVHGFRTEWHYLMLRGYKVWLKLPGYNALEATVAWAHKFQIGCEFTTPIHPAVLAKIVADLSRAKAVLIRPL